MAAMVHACVGRSRRWHGMDTVVHLLCRRCRLGHGVAAMIHAPRRLGRRGCGVAAMVHLHRIHARHAGPIEPAGVDIAVGHPHGAGGREGKDLLKA